jgi:hypothetical protein
MPITPPNPRGIQEAARRLITEGPTFTREDGSRERREEVPEEIRNQLEAAHRGVLSHIADSLEVAQRLEEAVRRDDKNAVGAVMREAGVPREGKFTVVEIRSDFYCSCRFCMFGHCCSCTISVT